MEEFLDRLALAWVRLNCWEWDDILGDKPEGFDTMTDHEKRPYIDYWATRISTVVGKARISKAWWEFKLGRNEVQWTEWFLGFHDLSGLMQRFELSRKQGS